MGALKALIRLDISQNQLRSIPPEIGNLKELIYLDLSDNQLTAIPPEISGLKGLNYLYIMANQLREIPPAIGSLVELIKLGLSDNQITTLPSEIGNLKELTHLYLTMNQLRALPPNIGNLKRLIELRLNDNQLTFLPAAIGNLVALTHLYLNGNELKSLPPEIVTLIRLNGLYLSCNRLTCLPSEIGSLASLTELDLSYNQITLLPPEVDNLVQLQSVCVGERPISPNHIYGNLLVSVSENILKNFLSPELVVLFNEERDYLCQFSLSSLYQSIVRGEPEENIKEKFNLLQQKDKDFILDIINEEHTGMLSCEILEQLQVFEVFNAFVFAVKEAVINKFYFLDEDEKNRVCEKIYELAGSPQIEIEPKEWGMNHAFNNIPRLADALALCG